MKKSPFKKNVSILYIYDKLLNNRYLDKKEVQAELLINDLTFKRYIKDLREYFSFMRKDEEIYYDRWDPGGACRGEELTGSHSESRH